MVDPLNRKPVLPGLQPPAGLANEESFRSLLSTFPDLLFLFSPDGDYLDYHATHPTLLPAAPEQFLGKNVRDVLPHEVAERLIASCGRVWHTGQSEAVEYPLPVAGEIRHYECRVTAYDGQRLLAIVRDITARKKTETELRAQEQLLENLLAVARTMYERPSVRATLQNALEIALALTGATGSDLTWFDSSGAVIHYTPSSHLVGGAQQAGDAVPWPALGLTDWVAQHRQTALIPDTRLDERWLRQPGPRGVVGPSGAVGPHYQFHSALSVPILAGSNLVGVLTLAHAQPDHFSSQHLRLIQATADEIVQAVRNAEIFEEQHRMAERQATLYGVLRAVSGLHDLNTVAKLAVEAIVKFAGWPHVALILPNEAKTQWVVCAASGHLTLASGMTRPLTHGIVGRAFRTGLKQLVSEVAADPDYVAGHPGTRSELAVPLRHSSVVKGVLALDSDQVAAFKADDIVLAESLTDAIALALENAGLYAQVQRHVADMSALYAITRTTSRSLAMEDVLEQALLSAITSLGFSCGLIALAESDEALSPIGQLGELRLAAVRGLPADLVRRFHREGLQDTLTAYVHQHRESLIIADSQQDVPPEVGQAMDQMSGAGYRSYAGIALLHQGKSLGAISLLAREARSSSTYDLALLGTIGQQIAVAVVNARLFQVTLAGHSRSQALINSSRDGIILVGMTGRILILNESALKLLRLPGQTPEWLGRSLKDMLPVLRLVAPAALRAAIIEARRLRLGSELPGEGEFEVPPRTVQWISLPVMTGTLPQGRLIVLADVTDERAVERLREDMTHTMVHDLRNPLGNISGALEMVTEGMLGEVPSSQLKILEVAQHGARRMIELVTAILDVSRLESGQMPLEQRGFSLAQLVTQALTAQSTLAHDKQIRLDSHVPPDLPEAWADVGLIARVLQNLIGNAIKFTPPGGAVQVAATWETSAPRPRLLVQISDTGAGIPSALQSRLFQKFVSGEQRERGSGLGLAFCKLAVEAHGERIWVESTPDQGTTFSFSLALAPSNA
ncbi:two-component system, NarL family, sensor histidine kinase EvgS [Thermoflexales bacterium]|nr:two-component system, NarL family, sensor histidine kinase EvgS [Thermoflexales bacterium]